MYAALWINKFYSILFYSINRYGHSLSLSPFLHTLSLSLCFCPSHFLTIYLTSLTHSSIPSLSPYVSPSLPTLFLSPFLHTLFLSPSLCFCPSHFLTFISLFHLFHPSLHMSLPPSPSPPSFSLSISLF